MKKLSVLIISLIMLLALSVAVCANTLGDADNIDGVTVFDARIGLRYALNMDTSTIGSDGYRACDVDGFCGVSIDDARLLLRYAIGMDKSFPSANGITGHSWDAGKITKAASCAQTGVKTYTCSVCKDTKTEDIAKLTTHTWNSGSVAKSATCTADGEKIYTCSVCNITKTEIITALGHKMTKTEVKSATCEAIGNNEYYFCSICKKYFKDINGSTETTVATETVPAKGHSYGKWVSNANGTHSKTCANDPTHVITENCSGGNATCTAEARCKDCNSAYGKKLAHSFTNYIYNNDATCLKAGTKTAKCDYCDAKDTIADTAHPMLNHSYTGTVKNNNNGTHSFMCINGCNGYGDTVNCVYGQVGCNDIATCSVCAYSSGTAIGHDWNDGEITTPATCTVKGVMTYTCKRNGCGATKNEEIALTSHNLEKHDALPACLDDGNVEFYECQSCHKLFKADGVTETTQGEVTVKSYGGHDYSETVIKVTCTTDGYTKLTCTRCGSQTVKEGSEVESTGHVYTADWNIVKEATCTEEGIKTCKCNKCGEVVTETIPLLEHKVDTVNPVNVAGSTENNTSCHLEFKCTVCKHTIYTVENKGHVYGKLTREKATCTTAGSAKKTCIYCGYVDTTVIEPLGHEANIEETKKATCTEEGYILFSGTCTRCSAVLEGEASKVTLPATGHTPNRDYADCTNAIICEACKSVITPALGHDYSVTASGLGTNAKRFYCVRCNKLSTDKTELISTFNTLVNGIKSNVNGTVYLRKNPVSILEKSVTSSSYKSFDFGIYTSMVKDLYDEEMSGETVTYSVPKENSTAIYNYQKTNSTSVVSELTDADVRSIKVEKISGITGSQLLSDFDASFEIGTKTYDISKYKTTTKLADSMIKVTVNLVDDELQQSGGNVDATDKTIPTHMQKIYNYDIRSEMFNVNGTPSWTYTENEGNSETDGYEITLDMTLKSAKSKGTVTYYFNESTMEPVAAVYELARTVDQNINMKFKVAGMTINGKMEPIINTTGKTVYFFVDYLPSSEITG